MYKELRKGDSCYTGWGCPWILSLLEHPVYLDPGDGIFCSHCGDKLLSNGSVKVMERDAQEKLYVANLRDKNIKMHQRYKEEKTGGFKGLKGSK